MRTRQPPAEAKRPRAATRCAPPSAWGSAPRFGAVLGAIAATAGALGGCMNTDSNRALPPAVVAISDTTTPLYEQGDTKLYQVQTQVRLPMKKPTDDEAKALGKSPPFPHAPFLNAADVRYEVRFTISNLDDAEHNVELLVDPWNEFARYRPGVVVSQEAVTPNYSGFDRYFVVPAKSRVEGSLTPDDMRELAVDLATAMNILDHPPAADGDVQAGALINRAMNQQNRSSVFDPLLTPYVPAATPGLIGFDLGLRSTEAMNVAVEIYVDITDLAGTKMATIGGTDAAFGVPGRFIEPPPPAMNN